MQFIYDNGIYKVARITGPTHNFLGVCIDEKAKPIETIELPIKEGEIKKIESEDVLAQVLDGLKNINHTLGKDYHVSKIYFIPSDSPSNSVYSMLINELIKRIDNKESFVTP